MSNSDTPKTVEEILRELSDESFDAGVDDVDGYDAVLDQLVASAVEAINALRRADMEAVIGKSKPQYQWGDGTAKSLWYEAQHKLQEEQRKRMKERLNG